MTSVEAWEPELPPLLRIRGMKKERAATVAISCSKPAMTDAVSSCAKNRTVSQPPRLRMSVKKPTRM